MSYKLQFRGGTASEWTTANPTLANREVGYETDSKRMKIGDGVTAWTSLTYWSEALVFPIWAEENSALVTGAYEWAYGNGDDTVNGSGIPVPFPCEIFAMGLDHSTAGSATVMAQVNGADVGAEVSTVSERNATVTFGTPIAVSAGDVIGFQTVTGTGSAGGNRVVVWLRANMGNVAGANEITVRKDSGSDVGTRPRLNFIEGTNATLTVTNDGTNNEVDITVSALGNVAGPASAVNENLAVFDLATGKLIKDSGVNISAVTANTAKNSYPSADASKLSGIEAGAEVNPTLSKSITVESPTSGDDITMFFTDVALTVTQINLVSTGTSPSTVWTLKTATDRSATGTTIHTGTTTSLTGQEITAITADAIGAGAYVWLELGTSTGTDVSVHLTITYTED